MGPDPRSVDESDLDATVAALLDRLASGPTVAIGLAKQAINHSQHATLNQAMTQELFNLELSCRTSDFKEGLAAFRDKRAPRLHRAMRDRAMRDKDALMSAQSYATIGYEVTGHTATITLNRPEALNALSPHMITELRSAYDRAENDDNIWLLIVTGTGRAFCTGADVKEIPRRRQGDRRATLSVHLRPVGSTTGRHPRRSGGWPSR